MSPADLNQIPADRIPWGLVRSGHDVWSKQRLHKLVGLVATHDLYLIQGSLDQPARAAAAIRWRCRGLDVAHAIAKIRHDWEEARRWEEQRLEARRHETMVREALGP